MNPAVIGADVDSCFAHFTRRLGDLALHSEANRSRVAQLGGTELLVALLLRASDDAVLEGAAVALSNLALTEQGRRHISDAGGNAALVRLISAPVGPGPHAAAAGALRNMACWSEARKDIVGLGGVEALLVLCDMEEQGEHPAVQENAAAAIANLADEPACRSRVADIGGLEVLCALVSSAQADAVLACGAAALGNLADDETSRVKIAEAGGLEPLVRLCTGSTDDTVLESAAAAIANLAYNENNRKRLAQLNGIEPLVWLCAHSKSEAVLESTAAALGNLAYYNDLNRIRVAETGGLQALVQLCEAGHSQAVLEAAAGTLRHVIYNNESNRMRFIKAGGLELLVRLCASCDSEAVLESATAILRKTVASADIAQRLLDAHALPALLKVEREWTGTIRTYASQTLRALERHHRRAWSPPCAPHGKPTLAYMLLPAAHLSNMQPAIKKKAICRRPTTSRPLLVGGEEAGGEEDRVAVGRWAGQEVSAEELKREMDCVHTDLERVEAWLQGRAGCEILSGRCIEAADASIVLHNAGAVKALREFFASDEVDIFFLAYSGHATGSGDWCFTDCTISFDQVLTMWQQARARLRNTDARLCVLVDCPSAGAWAQSLLAVPAAAAFASGIAVQASCRAGEMAWSQDIGGEAGGVFTSWYTRAEGHGQSPWSLAEAGGGGGRGEPLPCHGQVPCMACKFDDFSARRAIMCLGGEDNVPDISLFGESWFHAVG